MTLSRDQRIRNREKTRTKSRIAQAFKQAPWRNQVQVAGVFLLILVIVLLVASVYLSISGRAAAAGLGAYQMNLQRIDLERQIADRKAMIALSTTSTEMEERAKALGFERIDPAEAIYITIPGYAGRQSVVLAPPPGVNESDRLIIKSIYRQSLWDWLFTGINRLSDSVYGGNS
jgi:hypothetical protein